MSFGFHLPAFCEFYDSSAVGIAAAGWQSGPYQCPQLVATAQLSDVNNCSIVDFMFTPLDMDGTAPVRAQGPQDCQDTCGANLNCSYFTFFPDSTSSNAGTCHLQGNGAVRQLAKTAISGPPNCNAPPQFFRNEPVVCEDNPLPNFTINGPLGPTEVTCKLLASYCNSSDESVAQEVQNSCPKTCGLCDIMVVSETVCHDSAADVSPQFFQDNALLPCPMLKYWCLISIDIYAKCPKTCGVCELTTTTTTTTSSTYNVLLGMGKFAGNHRQIQVGVVEASENGAITFNISNNLSPEQQYQMDEQAIPYELPATQQTMQFGCSRRRMLGSCANRRRRSV